MAAAKKAGISLSEPPAHIILLLNFGDESLLELDRADIDRHHQHFQDRPAVGTTRPWGDFQTGPPTLAIDFSFIRTVLSRAAAVDGIEVSAENMRLARIALRHLNLIGRSNERGAGILRSGATMPFVIESITRVDVEYQVLTAASPVSI